MTRCDAIVVGGGIAGLTAAYELTLAGLKPLLLEARGYVGGLIAGFTISRINRILNQLYDSAFLHFQICR